MVKFEKASPESSGTKRNPDSLSVLEKIALLPELEAREIIASLSTEDALDLAYNWDLNGRPQQFAPPEPWFIWLIMAGRGFGKTRTGAEWVKMNVEKHRKSGSQDILRIALVGRVTREVRGTMLLGESGILSVYPDHLKPEYEPTNQQVVWKDKKRIIAIGFTYTADEPNQLRGPQHHLAWCDELGAWKRGGEDTWSNLVMGMRLSSPTVPDPKVVITTTPRSTQLMKFIAHGKAGPTVTTGGSSYDNLANLPSSYYQSVIKPYENTRTGQQEIYAQMQEDVAGALWTQELIDKTRVGAEESSRQVVQDIVRLVVALDPAGVAHGRSDETGIVLAGVDEEGHAYVLGDFSLKGSPDQWAQLIIKVYERYGCDRIIAERNFGGDMVEHVIRNTPGGENVALRIVHASKGKYARAEPVQALYEQNKVHHMDKFPLLEEQMTTWVPGESRGSPDRMDALVWALTDLILTPRKQLRVL